VDIHIFGLIFVNLSEHRVVIRLAREKNDADHIAVHRIYELIIGSGIVLHAGGIFVQHTVYALLSMVICPEACYSAACKLIPSPLFSNL
jgi:hypothetical protein